MRNTEFSKFTSNVKQQGNKDWWNKNPMTYDWESDRTTEEGTLEWFKQVDNEFWSISKSFAHPKYPDVLPFSELIDYPSLEGKKVLEIGCGSGSIALVLANSGVKLTAIDITEKAVSLTKKRFQLFNTEAKVMVNDAEKLDFSDNTFDFLWSWGVIHHSANTEKIAKEILRVLKPGGRASIMIYNRNSTRYLVWGLYQGIFKAKFLRHHSLYDVNMTYTDGHIARHYTRKSAARLFKDFSSVKTSVMDSGAPDIPGFTRLTRWFPALMQPINRWIINRYGWFLFVEIVK